MFIAFVQKMFAQNIDVQKYLTEIIKENASQLDILKGESFSIIYVSRSLEPSKNSKEHLDAVKRQLSRFNKKLEQDFEELKMVREKMGAPVNVVEYEKQQAKQNSILLSALTSSETVTVESIFFRDDRVRREILTIKDSRPLDEILLDIQGKPESIRGMLTYYVYNNGFCSTNVSIGDHPFTPDPKYSVSVSALLDEKESVMLRSKVNLGIVNYSKMNINFLREFGHGFLSQKTIESLIKKNLISLSIAENEEKEKEIICVVGKQSYNEKVTAETCAEYRFLPNKGYAISSFKALLNGVVQSKMFYKNYIQIQDKVWFPQRILVETRVKQGEVVDAFNQVEYLFIRPPSLTVELDDLFFTINLTEQEKKEIEQKGSIQITRRAIEIPEELRQQQISVASDFLWRIVLMTIGIVFIILAILFRYIGAKKDK
jgi:hypothetical protein